MKYYRCRCGKRQSLGTYPPPPCVGCSECGTTLELHPEDHHNPAPHRWTVRYDTRTGAPHELCSVCMERRQPQPETIVTYGAYEDPV